MHLAFLFPNQPAQLKVRLIKASLGQGANVSAIAREAGCCPRSCFTGDEGTEELCGEAARGCQGPRLVEIKPAALAVIQIEFGGVSFASVLTLTRTSWGGSSEWFGRHHPWRHTGKC